MKKNKGFTPDWTNTAPKPGTFRSIFKWGSPEGFKHPNRRLYETLKEKFGMGDEDFQKKVFEGNETVTCDTPVRLKPEQISRFKKIVGEDNISSSDYDRLRYSTGKTVEEAMKLRQGIPCEVNDLVVHPRNKDDVREIISYCNTEKIPVTVYGGGSSVTMGLRCVKGGITMAMNTHMNRVLSFNETNQTITVEPGLMGPAYESILNNAPEKLGAEHRYTGGHFPQSFELSTLGGWIATRSSGQQSYYYGRIEDLFKGGHIESPRGPVDLQPFPASAAGPDLKQLFLGSEGRLGFITRAIVAIHPIPEFERFYGVFFRDWENGLRAVRELAQKKLQLSMMRLSDPQETETTLILSGKRNLIRWAEFGFNALGYRHERCLLILGVTGGRNQAVQSKKLAFQTIRKYGGFNWYNNTSQNS